MFVVGFVVFVYFCFFDLLDLDVWCFEFVVGYDYYVDFVV